MPAINTLKTAEFLVRGVQSTSAKLSKEVSTPETAQRTVSGTESLRAYAGVIIRNMYANTESLAKNIGYKTPAELEKALADIGGVKFETLNPVLSINRITDKQLGQYISEKCYGGTLSEAIKDGLYVSKDEFLADFVRDLQAYTFIKNHPVFEPYNLNMAETSEIFNILKSGVVSLEKKKSGVIDFASIENLLKNKNKELYETLGSSEMFTEQTIKKGTSEERTFIPSRESLQVLQDNLCGKNSLKQVLENSESVKTLDFKLNGVSKSFLYKDALKYSTDIPKINDDAMIELIHSNFLTLDLIKSPEFKKLLKNNPEIKRIADEKIHVIKNPKLLVHGNKETDINFWDLADKLKKQGIDSLNSYEIHTLTDTLENVYKAIIKKRQSLQSVNASSAELEKTSTDALIKSFEPKAKKMYGVVQRMKETIKQKIGGKINKDTKQYSKDGIYFSDHFFMRMIDRDLANVTENEKGKVLSVDELMERIIETAKGGLGKKNSLSELHGNGLTLISHKKDGHTVISTLMQ